MSKQTTSTLSVALLTRCTFSADCRLLHYKDCCLVFGWRLLSWLSSLAMILYIKFRSFWACWLTSWHYKPYNKEFYDHIQCFTAPLWWTVQSWELELDSDVDVAENSDRAQAFDSSLKNTMNGHFKDEKLTEWSVMSRWCSNTITRM